MNKVVRRLVQRGERAAAVTETMLPRRPVNRRWLAAAGLFWAYGYQSVQTLHLVNGLPQTVRVQVQGQPELPVPPGERLTCSLREGSHRAVLRYTDGAAESVDFGIRVTGLDHGRSVFVLNPRGAASLLLRRVVYAADNVLDCGLSRPSKTLLLAAVAARRPDLRQDLLPLARRLDFSRLPPHGFLRHALAAMR
jgi:hypothetical protein